MTLRITAQFPGARQLSVSLHFAGHQFAQRHCVPAQLSEQQEPTVNPLSRVSCRDRGVTSDYRPGRDLPVRAGSPSRRGWPDAPCGHACRSSASAVVPAGRAAARRGARHRVDLSEPHVQGPQAGHLDRRAPAAVRDRSSGCSPPCGARAGARGAGRLRRAAARPGWPGGAVFADEAYRSPA